MRISRINPFSVLLKRAGPAGQKASFFSDWLGGLRRSLGTPVVLAGLLFGTFVRMMPTGFFLWSHSVVLRRLAGGRRARLSQDSPGKLAQARTLCRRLKDRHRREPAILCAISHPPVDKDTRWLNFEMINRAFEAIFHVRERASKPKVVVAIDELAVGFAGLVGGSFYAGGMHAMHLGIDRLPHDRGVFKRALLAGSEPQYMPWRLLKQLSGGGEIVIALSAGLPETGRAVYIIREFISRLRKLFGAADAPRWLNAEEELFLLALARGSGNRTPAESGVVSQEMCELVLRILGSLGCPESEARAHLAVFVADFRRETAFRERFFNFLLKRIAKEGTPLLLMGLNHNSADPCINVCDTISNASESGDLLGRGGGDQFLQSFRDWVELNFK